MEAEAREARYAASEARLLIERLEASVVHATDAVKAAQAEAATWMAKVKPFADENHALRQGQANVLALKNAAEAELVVCRRRAEVAEAELAAVRAGVPSAPSPDQPPTMNMMDLAVAAFGAGPVANFVCSVCGKEPCACVTKYRAHEWVQNGSTEMCTHCRNLRAHPESDYVVARDVLLPKAGCLARPYRQKRQRHVWTTGQHARGTPAATTPESICENCRATESQADPAGCPA